MALAGLGAVGCVAGLVVLGPVAARPAGALLGVPLRGVSGLLARRNAAREPRRVAGAATALMVGIGVVTLITVLAASSRASVRDTVGRAFGGDLVITTGSSIGGGFDPRLAGDVARLPQVQAAAGMGTGGVRIDGAAVRVAYADPAALARVLDLGSGANAGPGRIAVSRDEARKHGWHVGTAVTAVFADGARRTLTVGGTYPSGGPAGDYLLSRTEWTAHDPQPRDTTVLVGLRPGVGVAEGERAVAAAARPYAAPDVMTRKEYVDAQASGVNILLTLVYVMLALAIVIALLGIANTLSLSVHERTRELGLLRAAGATRGQVRSMIRGESLIVALFGTVGGLGAGLVSGWALARAATGGTFAVPGVQLVVIVVVGAVAGVLAALRPARRAARLEILRAVAE
jgi:putative ABC transport system permease protein